MKRIYIVLSTILILSGALYVYCILAVPLLEPPSQYVQRESDTKWNSEELQLLKALFKKDDWELEQPRHIAFDNIHLFVKDYKITEKGEIKVNSCSIVIVNNDSSLRINERYSRSTVIQCSGEATLRFEQSLLRQGLGGNNQFRGGVLNGEIHIYCNGEPNTKEDDLDIRTRDINIDADRAWTQANIMFSYGRTHGVGSGLQIQFISKKFFNQGNTGMVGKGLQFDKISLNKLQSLTFYLPKTENKYEPGGITDPNIPFTMQCNGNFTFNALNKSATFKNNVILTRQVPNKKPETVHCDLLNLQFINTTNKQAVVTSNKNQNNPNLPENSNNTATNTDWNLTLYYVEALGKKVILSAPEYSELNVVTSHLIARIIPEFTIEIESENTDQFQIQYQNYEFYANSLIYKIVDNDSIGYLECNSRGWFGTKAISQINRFRARWNDSLEVTINPKDSTEHVLTMKGNALLEFTKDSQTEAKITADNIYFWFKKTHNELSKPSTDKLTTTNKNLSIQPERMKALNNVEISSYLLDAKLQELQLWLVPSSTQNSPESGALISQSVPQNNSNQGFNFLSTDTNDNSKPSVHYTVSGQLLRGNIVSSDAGYEVLDLTLKDNVEIASDNVSTKDPPKLKMVGNLVEIHDVTKPIATANLIGEPACIQYDNVTLKGTAVNVNRGTNRIWIDSPGEAEFISKIDSNGKSLDNDTNASLTNIVPNNEPQSDIIPQTEQKKPVSDFTPTKQIVSKIAWKQKLELEGNKIKCSGGVVMDRENVFAQCDTLTVELSDKINLQSNQLNLPNSNNGTQQLEIRNIILSNAVKLENSTYENNQKIAQDTLYASEINLKMMGETFIAKGPGRAMTQRNAQPINLSKMFSKSVETSNNSVSKDPTETSDKIRLMHFCIDFQNELTGSFNVKKPMTFTFTGRVETIYGPINQIGEVYESYDVTKKPVEELNLRCDVMEINVDLNSLDQNTNMTPTTGNLNLSQVPENFNFSSTGGVVVENLMYSVNAARVTYQAKNHWMKIEGDGQVPAQFFYKKVRNGRFYPISSSTINYNTETNSVSGEGIQDFTLFPE